MTNAMRTLTVPVTEGIPSPLEMQLSQALPAGSLLRLRANGLTMLRGLRIERVEALPATGPNAECHDVTSGATDDTQDGVDLEVVHRYAYQEMQQDWMWHIRTMSIAVVRTPCRLPSSSRVVIHCKTGSGVRIADLTWDLRLGRVKSVEEIDFLPVADPLRIVFVAGPAEQLEAFLKSRGHVVVQHLDAFGNPTRPEAGEILTIESETRRTDVPAVSDTAATVIEGAALNTPEAQAGQGQAIRRVRVTDKAGRAATTNALPIALDGTPIYFGEFHWHTEFSGDGQRSLQAALSSARDELGLDFAGPADHMSPDGTYAERLPIEQAEICRRFDEPGRFCTIPSAELSGRYGHANLVVADFETFLTIVKRFPHELLPAWREMPDSYPLEVLAALCPAGKAMIVPHHTNMDSSMKAGVVREDGRPFWCGMHWPQTTPLLRQGVRLLEIVQNRGAFEMEEPNPDWRVHWGRLGGSARTALLRGHRVGFVGGTDNHTGWPTRLMGEAGYGGLTAVTASALNGTALFDALNARRCYATSGARIVADATLNDHPLGSELQLAPDAPRAFRIRVHGTAPLVAVQIISMGTVLADLPVDGDSPDLELTWSDDRPGRPLQDVYYYVRARQADGHCAWLSPWWVDLAGE
ncbi:MAG: hypothetical protein ACP5HG_13365 [Anaerolineae bacterium]